MSSGIRLGEDRQMAEREYGEAQRAARAGRFDAAIATLRHVLAAAPEHVESRVLLGECLAEVGECGAAEGMLRSATALDPVHIGARLQLGGLLVSLGRPGEALTEYRAVLAVDPDQPAAREKVVELSRAT